MKYGADRVFLHIQFPFSGTVKECRKTTLNPAGLEHETTGVEQLTPDYNRLRIRKDYIKNWACRKTCSLILLSDSVLYNKIIQL
jgi:hypothetical protein